LLAREQDKPAFVNPPRGYEAKGAHWVKPDLVAEIAFTEWSDDGALRHPSFQGLRADKKATEVVREEPQAAPDREEPQATRPARSDSAPAANGARQRESRRKRKAEKVTVAGGADLESRQDLLSGSRHHQARSGAIFRAHRARIVPHVAHRPLSLVRCPDGWKQQCFYQKHADKSVNPAVDRIEVPEGDGTATYMGARNAKALVALLQWGVLELHPWGSRTPGSTVPTA
jgi:bifunctional non-homologous end joining protein LigD